MRAVCVLSSVELSARRRKDEAEYVSSMGSPASITIHALRRRGHHGLRASVRDFLVEEVGTNRRKPSDTPLHVVAVVVRLVVLPCARISKCEGRIAR